MTGFLLAGRAIAPYRRSRAPSEVVDERMRTVPKHHRGVPPAESSVVIDRAVGDVYAYYTDMTHLPAFLGDVLDVSMTGPRTARWTVALPLGLKTRWTTTITEARTDALFAFQTSTLGFTTSWRLTFEAHGRTTTVHEVMTLPGGRPGRVLLALLGKHPQGEVEANLRRLKQVLETGRVTDNANTMGKRFS